MGLAAAASAQILDQRDPYGDGPVGRYRDSRYGRSVSEWVARLGDSNPQIRLDAVKSMGESRDPAVIPHLIEAVLDSDPRVAVRAADYLGKLKATQATDFLCERLFLKSTSDPLRHQILGTIAEIGDSRALSPLLEFVKQTERPKLRGAAIFALGEIGDSTIEPRMAEIADNETDPGMKRLANEALAKIAGRRFEPTPLPTGFPDPLFRPIEPAE